LLGDYSVGKTCIAKRYVSDSFEPEYKPSIGVDILSRQLKVGKHNVQLQIWDMSGQTEFRRLRRQYLEGTDCGIIVFDLTRRSSLDAVPTWLEESREINPKLPAVLVGNKSDMVETRAVTRQEAAGLAKSLRLLFYTETSTRLGTNVDKLFRNLAVRLLTPAHQG
jgi:small GTP-binding protein